MWGFWSGWAANGWGWNRLEPSFAVCAEVTIQKHKISTETKLTDLKGRVKKDVDDLLRECLTLLKTEMQGTANALAPHATEILSSELTLCGEELMSSPLKTMMLRWVLANQMFSPDSGCEEMSQTQIEKLVDADPFLGGLQDCRKPDAVKPLAHVIARREEWDTLKTVHVPETLVHSACPTGPTDSLCLFFKKQGEQRAWKQQRADWL